MIETVINLADQFKKQAKLDAVINKNSGVKDPASIYDKKVLELYDEFCELMNKMRIHKYWSKNNAMGLKEDLLEEYVDGWHMLLSIGNDIDVPWEHGGIDIRQTFTQQFRAILFTANDVYRPIGWTLTVSLWKGLGVMLKFTPEEVTAAFEAKHSKNLERQANGY